MQTKKCKYCLREEKYKELEIVEILDTITFTGYQRFGFPECMFKPPLFEQTEKKKVFECKKCKRINEEVLERGEIYENRKS